MNWEFLWSKSIIIVLAMVVFRVSGQTNIGNFLEIGEIQKVGDRVFFIANDGIHGNELWVTDGDRRTTKLVKDIRPGNDGSLPANLISFKGELYFSATDPINGRELWKSDGTPDGTVRLAFEMEEAGRSPAGSNPSNFFVFGDHLYFIAYNRENYGDLWKTDGTSEGTSRIFGIDYVSISELTLVENDLYFVLMYGPNQLWQMDLLTGESKQIEIPDRTDEHYFITELNLFNRSLIFILHTSNRQEIMLYTYRSTSSYPDLLHTYLEPRYGSQYIGNFTSSGELLYFSVKTDYNSSPDTDVLWKSDGTKEGTALVKSFNWSRHESGSGMQHFVNFNNVLYFRGSSSVGNHLYKSDGTTEGTLLVKNVALDSYIRPVVSDSKLYFADINRNLWESDGTSSGTRIKYLGIELMTYIDPTEMVDADGVVYFKGSDQSGLGIWNTVPNAKIEISHAHGKIIPNANLVFKSEVDSSASYLFEIKNLGEKELFITQVKATGSDFFLEGVINQFLLPGQSTAFQLMYFPFSERESRDILEIYSNDETKGVFKINLHGLPSNTGKNPRFPSSVLAKELMATNTDAGNPIHLDNTKLPQNSGRNKKVGVLSYIGADSAEFQFAEGVGDRDNGLFEINGNELIALRDFQFESNNVLTIRIEGKAVDDVTKHEKTFIIQVENSNEILEFTNCITKLTDVSYSLNDVSWVEKNSFIAVGQSGVIIKSDDNGNSWRQINSGTQEDLIKVQFIDNRIGYALGYWSKLLKTENGGEDWFFTGESGLPVYNSSMFFINENKGLVFGYQGEISETTDGGATWKTQNFGYRQILDAVFFDEQVGFMCGASGNFLKTLDGGDTWVSIDLRHLGWNLRFMALQFLSDSVGFLAASDGGVFKTSDAGLSWENIGNVPLDYLTDIHFVDELNGYATGGWSMSNIFKTENGGIDWKEQSEYNYYHNTISLAFNPDHSRACAVGYGNSLGSTGERGRTILTMKDEEWTVNSSLQYANFQSTNYINDKIALVFGERNFKTTNGGLTWNEFKIPNVDSYGIIGSFFLDQNLGYAVDRYAIYNTVNGGDSWTKYDKETSHGFGFRNIYFFNQNLGFAFGWEDLLFRTEDGGKNWSKLTGITNSSTIEDMVFLSSKKGFAVSGNPAEILKTEDGGLTWQALNNFYLKWLRSIHFFDDLHGIVVGHDGFTLKTWDGGETWDEIKTGIGYNFISLSFVDSEEGYAACNNGGGLGAIFKTVDSGESWSLITQSEDLYDVGGFGQNHLFVGRRGKIYMISQDSPPAIPGPISGPTAVSIYSPTYFSVPLLTDAYYNWEVEGTHSFEFSNNRLIVTWDQPGRYALKVTPYNSCGEGKPRAIFVDVEASPKPLILGADSVSNTRTEVYLAKYEEKNRINWNVDGASNFRVYADSLQVNWKGGLSRGSIELMETNIQSGGRGKARLDVYILTEDFITSLEIKEIFTNFKIFPNPTSDYLKIDLNHSEWISAQVRILDLSGKVLLMETITPSNDIRIDLKHLPSGLYLLEFTSSGIRNVSRIIKK